MDLGLEWAQLWFYKSEEAGKSGGAIQGPGGECDGVRSLCREGNLLPETPVVFRLSARSSVIFPLCIGASATIWPDCSFHR